MLGIIIIIIIVLYVLGSHSTDYSVKSSENNKVVGRNQPIISNNHAPESILINEHFYNYVTSLTQDDLETKVLYYYNTYKGSSNLIPVMGEFGSIEFVNLMLLMNYLKNVIDENLKAEGHSSFTDFLQELNFKCLVTLGFAFNHMSPGEFSDELDKIIKPHPEIMEYSEWSKVYRYSRDNHGDWIHKQEFAYGTPELQKDGGGETQLIHDRHYREFAEVYNELVDYDSVIRFYKRQGLNPDFCVSYYPE